jgi:hypothetical protein
MLPIHRRQEDAREDPEFQHCAATLAHRAPTLRRRYRGGPVLPPATSALPARTLRQSWRSACSAVAGSIACPEKTVGRVDSRSRETCRALRADAGCVPFVLYLGLHSHLRVGAVVGRVCANAPANAPADHSPKATGGSSDSIALSQDCHVAAVFQFPRCRENLMLPFVLFRSSSCHCAPNCQKSSPHEGG